MYFWNQSRMSSRDGSGLLSMRALAETMKPGVQKPHWAPPWIIQAICRACRSCGVPMPSMVVMAAPSGTRSILVIQERISLPSMITLQAPHWPLPQPTLVPVRRRLLRMTSASRSEPSVTTERSIPFTYNFFFCMENSRGRVRGKIRPGRTGQMRGGPVSPDPEGEAQGYKEGKTPASPPESAGNAGQERIPAPRRQPQRTGVTTTRPVRPGMRPDREGSGRTGRRGFSFTGPRCRWP